MRLSLASLADLPPIVDSSTSIKEFLSSTSLPEGKSLRMSKYLSLAANVPAKLAKVLTPFSSM